MMLFCVAISFTATAQNIFVKPFGGSAFGFSSVENQTTGENFEVSTVNSPSFNAYYGLSIEWQKDTKNRFEMSFATQEVALGYKLEYNSTVTGELATYRIYSRKPSLNISLNYARNLGSIGLKTGKIISFDGIIGASFIKKSSLGFQRSSILPVGNLGNYQLDIEANKDYPHSFGVNLGFATRLHNAKGNAVMELRFQYIKSFVEMRYQNVKYEINGQEIAFRQSTNGSMINFAFGIPIRVLNTAKK